MPQSSRFPRSARVVAAALACATAITLAGCSAQAPGDPAPKELSATAPTAVSPMPTEPATTPSGDGARPSWATEPLDIGTEVGETATADWSVRVYEVGVAVTETDGTWAMPDSNEPVMPAGTSMAIYNVVLTNTSSETQLLDGAGAAMVEHFGVADYQRVLGTNEDALYEAVGLTRLSYDIEISESLPKYGDERGFPVAPGESFGIAISTWAEPGDVKVSTTVNTMDEQGKRIPDAGGIFDVEFVRE